MEEIARYLARVTWRKRLLAFEAALVALLLLTCLTGLIYGLAIERWSLAVRASTMMLPSLLFVHWIRGAWRMVAIESRILREEGVEALLAFRKAHPVFDVRELRRITTKAAQPTRADNAG